MQRDKETMDPRAAVMRCESPVMVNAYTTQAGVHVAAARRPCGHCSYCCWRYAREAWGKSDREFEAQAQAGRCSVMGTLTLSPAALPGALPDLGQACYRAFSKRVNDRCPGLKWFAVPELGERHQRLHVHFIAYGVPRELCQVYYINENHRNVGMFKFRELVRACWPGSFERCDVARGVGAGRYVMKYLGKGRDAEAQRRHEWREHVLWPAKYWQRQEERERVRHGRRPRTEAELKAALPVYVKQFWTAWPRGRQGGLGAAAAQQLAASIAANSFALAEAQAIADAPRYVIKGTQKRPDGSHLVVKASLTRYERRVCRRRLDLETPACKATRAARDPERVEIACRIRQAGGVKELRNHNGHVDADVAAVFKAKALSAKSLGRW